MARSLAFVLAALSVQSSTGLRLGGSASEKCFMPEPELQLRKKYYVALFTAKSQQNSDYQMLKEGVQDHPMLELVSDMSSADYVINAVSGSMDVDMQPPVNVPQEKIILVDFSDGPMIPPYLNRTRWNALFKRSYVYKEDGVFTKVGDELKNIENHYPFAYGVMNQYLEHVNANTIGDEKARPVSMMCSLRAITTSGGEQENIIREYFIARNRVLSWLHSDPDLPQDAIMSKGWGLTNEGFDSGISSLIETAKKVNETRIGKKEAKKGEFAFDQVQGEKKGEFSFDAVQLEKMKRSESSIGPEYEKVLQKTRVAVTANPASYEGDHRLWEHFANGHAVLSDPLYIPLPFPPENGKHFIQYDIADTPANKEAFLKTLHGMLDNKEKMKKMACAGMQLAARHHRSVSRVDYIFRTMAQQDEFELYTETGKTLKDRIPKQTASQAAYAENFRQRHPAYVHNVM